MAKGINKIEHLIAETVVFGPVAADGGTQIITVTIDGEFSYSFFIDGRIGSDSLGEIFSQYPGNEDSELLDPTSNLAISIKKLIAKNN